MTATVNGRWSKTYLDGLGRTYETDAGDASSTKSIVSTVYDSCGCTPMGKPWKVSLPYAPGATPVWKTYTYDAVGRTLTAVAPDGASTTSYLYTGNTVKITDPAGKWKQYTTDAFGQLTQVVEPSPNPASEPDHVTLYSYDLLGHLTQASMGRTIGGTVNTQTRTWNYDATTQRLSSVTTPESGTVTYAYNADGSVASITDAKSQRKVYTYDSYGRVTIVKRGTVVGGTFTEDVSQRTSFQYDTPGSGDPNAANQLGRLSQITYSGPHGLAYTEWYSYAAAGGVTRKHLGGSFGGYGFGADAVYTYDNEGRVSSVSPIFGNNQPVYTYGYDSMGRLSTMKDQNNTQLVSGVTYGAAGQMLSLSGTVISETRVYNSNLQLTELTSGNTGQMGSAYHFKYNYSATQNDGRVSSITDVASGETITYQYDTLKRLVSAAGSGDPTGAWSQTFTYDGFGNLLQKLGSNAPNVNYSVNPLNNRLTSSSAQYDLNGNLTSYTGGGTFVYDIENRITSSTSTSGGAAYAYDSANQRVYKAKVTGSTFSNEEVYLYGIDGKKLETVSITWSGSNHRPL